MITVSRWVQAILWVASRRPAAPYNSSTKTSIRSKVVRHMVTMSCWMQAILWGASRRPAVLYKLQYKDFQQDQSCPAHGHYVSLGAGHSLGGFTAACSAIFFKDILRVTTFESPGLTSFYHSLARQEGSKEYWQQRVVNYLSVPNPINTCQRHLGLMIR